MVKPWITGQINKDDRRVATIGLGNRSVSMFKSRTPREPKIRRAGIVSVGRYVPDDVLTNFNLEEFVDTSNEWIVERTGIKERHFVRNGQRQSDLALNASREALARVGWKPMDLDLIIVATVTPDHIFPSSANTLAGKLGAIGVPSYDCIAACSGFLYALYQGTTAIESGRADKVLVVGSEVMSSLINWSDRGTCVLFGDAAGAVLLEAVEEPRGLIDFTLGSDGRHFELLHMPGGGSAHPATHETVDKQWHYIHMEGSETFKFAVRRMLKTGSELLKRNGVETSELGCFIGHQANIRIINAVTSRLKLKEDQIYNNIDKFGNTTSATIPMCMYEAESIGRIRKDDWVLLVSFGAGLTWGGILLKWAVDPLPMLEPIAAGDAASDTYSDRLRPGRDWPRR